MPLTPAQIQAQEDRLQHAVKVHGLHGDPCTTCGGADPLCSTCNGHGVLYSFDKPKRCAGDCPLWVDA